MQAACSSKKSVPTKYTTRFHNQEAHNMKIQNLKTSVSCMKLSIMPFFPSSSYFTFDYVQVLFYMAPSSCTLSTFYQFLFARILI